MINAHYKHIVTKHEADNNLTVKEIIKNNFSFSKRFYTKMKFQNLIVLNDLTVPGYIKPKENDIIQIKLPAEKSDFPAENIPIDVIFEDDDLLIINKQPSITVHPTKGHPNHTIANGIMNLMLNSSFEYKIRFINRLDMDTSGIVIVAKNQNAQSLISKQMQHGITKKKYIAIVHGIFEEKSLSINLPIGKISDDDIKRAVLSDGKNAITNITLIKNFHNYNAALVNIEILTGRTHQIRVHLSHIGHPILGDELYGGDLSLINRQALHSYFFSFIHPKNSKKMEIFSPLPKDIKDVLNIFYSSKYSNS